MAAAPKLMTIDDYFASPETMRPAELAFGVLRVADSPSPRHQSAVRELLLALARHVRERKLGEIWVSPLDVVLDSGKALVVQPDLMFISNERADIVRDRVRGAPDLVIEILSPHPRIGTLNEHLRWFAEYGVKEAWIVHLDQRTVTVVDFAGGRIVRQRVMAWDDAIQSRVLPGFSLSLRGIFETRASGS